MQYGYMRVSSKDQNTDRQLKSLTDFGVEHNNVFADKLSGKNFNRPSYKKLIKKLREEDLLVIKSIDRLGRNYEEIIEEWRNITKVKKSYIVVLDMPLLDTRIKDKDLTGIFISDLVLQILSYVAQSERDNIKIRQAEGIAVAKSQGKHLGRPRKCLPKTFNEIHKKVIDGILTTAQASELLGVSRTTYFRWIKMENSVANMNNI